MPVAARASPLNSVSTPAMIRSSVDLPAPFRPSTPILAPGKKDNEMSFKISRFGLRQTLPQNGYFKKVDLAVVPAIGVDGAMARIGHGKGFYDMFFSGLKFKPAIAFVSIKDCFCSEILSLDHDVKGDFYITPSQNYLKRGKYDRDFNRLVRSCGGRWHRILSS